MKTIKNRDDTKYNRLKINLIKKQWPEEIPATSGLSGPFIVSQQPSHFVG